jgi:hypothetical protein
VVRKKLKLLLFQGLLAGKKIKKIGLGRFSLFLGFIKSLF